MNLPLHKNNNTTFFSLLTYGPLLHFQNCPIFHRIYPCTKITLFLPFSKCAQCTIVKLPNFLTNLPLHKNTKMTIFLPLSNLPHFYNCKTMPQLIAWRIQKQTDWQNTYTYKKTNKLTKTATIWTYRTDWHKYLQKDEQTDKNLYYLDLQDRPTDKKYVFSFLT